MYCYLFDIQGSLLHGFPRELTTPDGCVPALTDTAFQREKQRISFLDCLTDQDIDTFLTFCRSPKDVLTDTPVSTAVPSLLLFPKQRFYACFAGWYSSQTLTRTDPLPGEVAYTLGQQTMHILHNRFRNHHLVPTLAFHTRAELYHVTSPLLSMVSATVREMLAILEKDEIPSLYPCLQSHYREMYTTDIPPILDLPTLLPRFSDSTTTSPLFAGLDTVLHLPATAAPETCWVRCPVSSFLHVYLLLTYAMATLSGDNCTHVTLLPQDDHVQLHFTAANPRTSLLTPGQDFAVENELYTLLCRCPAYAGILTLAQYFLHRQSIPFSCSVTNTQVSVTLTMKTAIQDTLEFHSGDLSSILCTALPDAYALLTQLLP